jgi:hypothetical protein
MWAVTFGSLTGTLLNVRKNPICFPIWLGTNLIWTWYNLFRDIPSEAGLSLAYVLIAIWGIHTWKPTRADLHQLGAEIRELPGEIAGRIRRSA